MNMTRRDFLKWAGASAALLGLTALDLQNINKAMASSGSPAIIWLQGAACSGCTISTLNSVDPTIDDVLLNKASMKYHPTLNTAAGDLAITNLSNAAKTYAGQFILVVEGAIPTASSGKYCIVGEKNGVPWTMLDAVKELGPKAKQVIAAGTCASFKGIPGAGVGTATSKTDPMAVKSVQEVLSGLVSKPVINLPSCPVHPAVLVGVLVDVILGRSLTLDQVALTGSTLKTNRPTKYYGTLTDGSYNMKTIHSTCPRRPLTKVTEIGMTGCYQNLGCKGRAYDTINICPNRKWNNAKNWCINTNVPCIGCSSPNFPNFLPANSNSTSASTLKLVFNGKLPTYIQE